MRMFLRRFDAMAWQVHSLPDMKTIAAKRAAAESLIKAARGKEPKGVALVDFREPTAAERRKGRALESLARQCHSRNGKAAA